MSSVTMASLRLLMSAATALLPRGDPTSFTWALGLGSGLGFTAVIFMFFGDMEAPGADPGSCPSSWCSSCRRRSRLLLIAGASTVGFRRTLGSSLRMKSRRLLLSAAAASERKRLIWWFLDFSLQRCQLRWVYEGWWW